MSILTCCYNIWNKWTIYLYNSLFALKYIRNDTICWVCTFMVIVHVNPFQIILRFYCRKCVFVFHFQYSGLFLASFYGLKSDSVAFSRSSFAPMWAWYEMLQSMTSKQHNCIPGQRNAVLWSNKGWQFNISLGVFLTISTFHTPWIFLYILPHI